VLEPLKLCRGKTMIERVTVVKFGVNEGGANDASGFKVKVRGFKVNVRGFKVKAVDDVPAVVNDSLVDEEQVMKEYGKALRQVTDVRNTYTTTACDVCEQLKTKLSSLRSYENKKGFDTKR